MKFIQGALVFLQALSILGQQDKPIIELDDGIFFMIVEKYQPNGIFVFFHSPSCSICQEFQNTLEGVATQLLKEDPPIYFSQIDISTNKDTAEQMNVKDVPLLVFFFQDARPVQFMGEPKYENIKSFAIEKRKPSVLDFWEVKDFQNELKERKAMPLFYGSKKNEKYDKFEKVCAELHYIKCAFIGNKQLTKIYNIRENNFAILKTFDEKIVQYTGNWETDDVWHYINFFSIPRGAEIDDQTHHTIFQGGYPAIILFANESDKKSINIFNDLQEDLRNLIFTYADSNKRLGEDLGKYLGVKEQPSVWIVLQQPQKQLVKHKMDDKFTQSNILKFYNNFKNGKLKRYYKSENIPEKEYVNDIRVLVGKNFKEIVYQKEKDVVVFFFIHYCDLCENVYKEYVKLPQILERYKEQLLLAQIDMNQNDLEDVYIENYPVLTLYTAENKNQFNYTGIFQKEYVIE